MKTETINILYQVQAKLKECRPILDNAMYHDPNIPNEDYSKMREIYDDICKILDKL